VAAAAVFGLIGNAHAAADTQAAAVAVPVAAHALVAGTIISNADITQAEISGTRVYQSTPRSPDEVVGKRLVRPLKAGTPFNTLALKTANDVERNTAVTVMFKRPGIELSGTGLALEAGNAGKAIRVLNTESRATLVATVSGPGTVTIGDQ
jgi:flagella basal body P-ring formation protein FlgA